jgi:hypothetical protein
MIIRNKSKTGALCCCLHTFLLDVCKRFVAVVAGLGPSQSSGDCGDHVLTMQLILCHLWFRILYTIIRKTCFKKAIFSKENKNFSK